MSRSFLIVYWHNCMPVGTEKHFSIKTFCHQSGVPVYLAPWTACPPGGKLTAVGLPPRGQAVLGYLTPRSGYLHPRGASCPGRFILPPAHTKKILLCDVYYYLQHYNNYMQFLSYKYVNLNDYFKHSVGFLIDKGWGASCPGRFILPPAQNFKEYG